MRLFRNKIKFLPYVATVSLGLSFSLGFLQDAQAFGKKHGQEKLSIQNKVNAQRLWQVAVNDGSGRHYLKLPPAVSDGVIYSVGLHGKLTAVNENTGQVNWRVNLKQSITSGIAVSDNILAVGTGDAQVLALDKTNGQILWRSEVSNQVLASPKIANGFVFAKTADGKLFALNAKTGKEVWQYASTQPALMLRGGSMPQLIGDKLIVGFANGKLAAFRFNNGNLLWQEPIADPDGETDLTQMVDIDIDPVVRDGKIFVSTYQGKVAEINLENGRPEWYHNISAYSGMALGIRDLFISDENDHVWAFNSYTGNVTWRQKSLEASTVTGPALFKDYVVVADKKGYLYFLAKADGQIVGQIKVDSTGIISTPLVVNDCIYLETTGGKLFAYKIA